MKTLYTSTRYININLSSCIKNTFPNIFLYTQNHTDTTWKVFDFIILLGKKFQSSKISDHFAIKFWLLQHDCFGNAGIPIFIQRSNDVKQMILTKNVWPRDAKLFHLEGMYLQGIFPGLFAKILISTNIIEKKHKNKNHPNKPINSKD